MEKSAEKICRIMTNETFNYFRAVVVPQLVEWSLTVPEVRGSNQVIGKFILNIC